ncbi:hypothetical protein E4U41_005061, partial [Claviceps citrina]
GRQGALRRAGHRHGAPVRAEGRPRPRGQPVRCRGPGPGARDDCREEARQGGQEPQEHSCGV